MPGGGAAFLHLSELIPAFRATLTSEEEKLGADIIMKSLRAPCRIIADNSGVEGEVIVQKLLGLPFEVGYNAMIDKVENLVEAGVIDPAKVTRNGLLNATSIAGILLTTQVGGALDSSSGFGVPLEACTRSHSMDHHLPCISVYMHIPNDHNLLESVWIARVFRSMLHYLDDAIGINQSWWCCHSAIQLRCEWCPWS